MTSQSWSSLSSYRPLQISPHGLPGVQDILLSTREATTDWSQDHRHRRVPLNNAPVMTPSSHLPSSPMLAAATASDSHQENQLLHGMHANVYQLPYSGPPSNALHGAPPGPSSGNYAASHPSYGPNSTTTVNNIAVPQMLAAASSPSQDSGSLITNVGVTRTSSNSSRAPAKQPKRVDRRGARERPYTCMGCDATFDRPSSLRTVRSGTTFDTFFYPLIFLIAFKFYSTCCPIQAKNVRP